MFDFLPTRVEYPKRPAWKAANTVSMIGLGSAVAWLMGAPGVFAVVSIVCDELDGRLARSRGEVSAFGSNLDWAIDLSLSGAVAMRIGAPWLLPVLVPVQAAMRSADTRPAVGSARAGMMLYALVL